MWSWLFYFYSILVKVNIKSLVFITMMIEDKWREDKNKIEHDIKAIRIRSKNKI